MKKINFNDPRILIALGFIFFAIGAIDTWGLGATSWEEMYWWSKSALVGFCGVLGYMGWLFFFGPLFRVIAKVFKKKK